MTYIELLNRFDALDTEQAFSASATRLYVKLLAECNRGRWKNPFALADRRLNLLMGGSVNTMKKARTELEERGLLTYQSGGNGAGDSCVYALQKGANKVSEIDTLPANKVSDMVSISDTLTTNKVSGKVSEIDTIIRNKIKDSSVVEDKDTPTPQVCVGAAAEKNELATSKQTGSTDSAFLASVNSGGAALPAAEAAEARTLASAIALNWQISEQKNFQKWARIFRFCSLLAQAGQLDELRRQFKAYHSYRHLRSISAYNLDKYLGHETSLSPELMPYADGEWCGRDWVATLQEEQQAQAGKAAARPAFGPAPTATHVAGSLAARTARQEAKSHI